MSGSVVEVTPRRSEIRWRQMPSPVSASDTARSWRLSELAAVAGLSRAGFAERFKARVGKPPIEYATAWRMRIAARRLLDGRRSVSSVAQEMGFLSDSAFGAAFRRVHGISPGRYRATRERTA